MTSALGTFYTKTQAQDYINDLPPSKVGCYVAVMKRATHDGIWDFDVLEMTFEEYENKHRPVVIPDRASRLSGPYSGSLDDEIVGF